MSAMNDMLESEFQLKQEIESLRQQLAALTKTHVDCLEQLAHREAQIVMLRDALEKINYPIKAMRDSLPEGARLNGAMAVQLSESPGYLKGIANAALAATDDLSGYILCEREPVGYMFQHEDTGRTMCIEAQQVEWNFEKLNPRLFKVGPLYRAKEQGK